MQSLTPYRDLGTVHNERRLVLIEQVQAHLQGQSRTTFNWERHPICISEREMQPMDFSHVIEIMANTSQSPLKMAGEAQSRSPLILGIETCYRRALVRYKEELIAAMGKDLENTKALEEKWSKPAWGGAALLGLPLLAAGGMLWGAAGGAAGFLGGKEADKIYIKREGSVHRRAWLQKVDTWEKERYREARARIYALAGVLLGRLEELKADDQYDLGIVEELGQLARVYKVIPPCEKLTIQNIEIEQYLRQIENGAVHA